MSKTPWFVKVAAIAGRPIVLAVALVMSAPGEHQLAVDAGWSPIMAWGMAACLSVYAAVAAAIASTRHKGAPGRTSALWGAGTALGLAMAAQVVSHLMAAGYLDSSAFLVAATSSVPPLTVAHLLHLAYVPKEEDGASIGLSGVEDKSADAIAVADDFWEDMSDAPDDGPETMSTPPGVDEIRAAIEVIASVKGRPVTGDMLGEHFGVSGRTGRRYLSMAESSVVS